MEVLLIMSLILNIGLVYSCRGEIRRAYERIDEFKCRADEYERRYNQELNDYNSLAKKSYEEEERLKEQLGKFTSANLYVRR